MNYSQDNADSPASRNNSMALNGTNESNIARSPSRKSTHDLYFFSFFLNSSFHFSNGINVIDHRWKLLNLENYGQKEKENNLL